MAESSMVLRLLDSAEFDAIRAASPAGALGRSFLQSSMWARHKAAFGWVPRYFACSTGPGANEFPLLVLSRRLFAGKEIAYVPHGPEVGDLGPDAHAALAQLGSNLAKLLGSSCFLVRFDLNWILPAEGNRDSLSIIGLRRSPADVQPPDTVYLSLSGDEQTILARMHPKTRYNIRLAEKKGVVTRLAGLEEFDVWFSLYQATSARDRISIHSRDYYRTLMEKNPGTCELLLASHESDVLAGIILMHDGARTTYLYGASGNVKRNLMASHALQWAGISRAKARGSSCYDFFGIPASSDPAHPMHGLWQFKTGFGGDITAMYGCWDFSRSRVLYPVYWGVEARRFERLRKGSKKKPRS